MPAGLEIWDEYGALVLGTSTRTSIILGSIAISSNGYVDDAGFAGGTPFWLYRPTSYGVLSTPLIGISASNRLSWSLATPFNGLLLYGIY